MKKLYSTLLLIATLTLPLTATAYDFMVDGLCYNIISENEVKVTYQRQVATNDYNYPTYYSIEQDIIIPSIVVYNNKEYFVRCVGWQAFQNCKNLRSVVIPNSVTLIEAYSFLNSGLKKLTLPCSAYIGSAATGAFNWCDITTIVFTGHGAFQQQYYSTLVPSQFKNIIVGSGVTSIGNVGFTPDSVYCYAETPPTCSSGTFVSYDGELHVPSASAVAYFTAEYWQNFNNLVNDLTGKVTLDITSTNFIVGETRSLNATVIPENIEVLWSTSDPSVAIVDQNGVVTSTGVGECDIFASLASNLAVYAWCNITVSYPEISLSLSNESLYMNLGDDETLIATITPDNTGLTPTWSSSNESVATVDANGKVTAIGEGDCDITATVLDKIATCHVTVSGNVVISLDINEKIIGAGQLLTVYPSCSPDVPVELVVTSSDPSVALARVMNRTNAPAQGLKPFPEKGMALAMMEELAVPSESKDPALASEKAIMIVGVRNGTATITVTTADGKATPAVLELRVVDPNCDGIVDVEDVNAAINVILKLKNISDYPGNGDMDGNGIIDVEDVNALINIILKLN